jgi:hypothetical protein
MIDSGNVRPPLVYVTCCEQTGHEPSSARGVSPQRSQIRTGRGASGIVNTCGHGGCSLEWNDEHVEHW